MWGVIVSTEGLWYTGRITALQILFHEAGTTSPKLPAWWGRKQADILQRTAPNLYRSNNPWLQIWGSHWLKLILWPRQYRCDAGRGVRHRWCCCDKVRGWTLRFGTMLIVNRCCNYNILSLTLQVVQQISDGESSSSSLIQYQFRISVRQPHLLTY